ncbi:MAG: hypothetical protein PF503_11295, partial [Desulfobacula sp.]|nr:hypothetical protein [Desulfobacula sp.]
MNRLILSVSFDQMPCGETDENNLELKQVQSVFQPVNKAIDQEKLETLGLIVSYAGRKVLSNGGVILFAQEKYRNQYFPDARVSCARF